MDALNTFQKWFAALEAGDYNTLDKLTHEGYQFSGYFPTTVGKPEYIRIMKAFKAAMPDLSFNITNAREKGSEVVAAKMHFSGTQTGPLDLSFLGIPAQAPSRKKVTQPEEPITAVFKEGRLYRGKVESVPGGGLEGLLQQLGISLTPAL